MRSASVRTLVAAAVVHLALALGDAAAQDLAWAPVAGVPPFARTSAAMVYDAARGVAVLFGGATAPDNPDVSALPTRETWESSGDGWTIRSGSGPDHRLMHSMAYDTRRNCAVLFGGATTLNSTTLRDTWEWDGTAWLKRSTAGPSARYRHGMTYDQARGVTVLFGGRDYSQRNGETWEWNGAIWGRRTVAGPPARSSHAMVYDTARHVAVLFGGILTDETYAGDTWEWDGATWVQRATTGPSSRFAHAMAYDAARGVTVLFGGTTADGSASRETWEWDGTGWTLRAADGPSARTTHVMVYDPSRDRTRLVGGRSPSDPSPDEWFWDGQVWRSGPESPSERRGAAMVYDSVRGRTVLFGGRRDASELPPSSYSDTWEWDGSAWAQRSVVGPSARYGHAMAFDSIRGRTVLFGGTLAGVPRAETLAVAETWEWSGIEWTVRAVPGPPAQAGGCMAFDSRRRVAVLFGSAAASGLATTWEWDGMAWTQRVVAGPPWRSQAAMAYDAARGVAVLFGGRSTISMADTWEWDGQGWAQRLASGPSARYGHGLAFDESRRVVTLFGGRAGNANSAETWDWNGTAWTQQTASGPLKREGHAMSYDGVRGTPLVFGGRDTGFGGLDGSGGYFADTWALGTWPRGTVSPEFTSICPAEGVLLSVDADGSGPLAFQWRRGVPAAPIAGATDATYTTERGPGAADVYDCVVSSPFGSAATGPTVVVYDAVDYNCDRVANPDDLGDFITDYFAVPVVPGPGGFAVSCPASTPPYDRGYRAAYTTDGLGQCVEPGADNLSGFITAYFAGR